MNVSKAYKITETSPINQVRRDSRILLKKGKDAKREDNDSAESISREVVSFVRTAEGEEMGDADTDSMTSKSFEDASAQESAERIAQEVQESKAKCEVDKNDL